MFKLVVLFALAAVAVAKPSGVALGHVEYALPVSSSSAETHSYRKDVISEPAIVAAPIVTEVHAAPFVTEVHAAPISSSHTYRKDVISEPAYIAHAAPVVAEFHAAPGVTEVHAGPVLAHSAPVYTSSSSHQYRKDIINEPAYVAHAAPVVTEVHAAPVVAEVRAAPVIAHAAPVYSSSSSHQYRKDIISEPVYAAHAAPVVAEYRKDIISEPVYAAHATPVVAEVRASPVIAHAAPVISASSSHSSYRKDVISEPAHVAYAAPAAAYTAW
ncbi:unnamed protein product [Acanthoscelides obtectus]|uniref:Uncharacterized protein n=1 Tax=Acanthoscelides obtectus TaxID=200917 RepID=A0A9P0K0Q0_ACAOB|nr:unnamed protein product [Acanthoscelides obtectus]CAK1669582.1 hypothetical protein AOBTE_LOCUS27090 [Acanthoscelides obtectus]